MFKKPENPTIVGPRMKLRRSVALTLVFAGVVFAASNTALVTHGRDAGATLSLRRCRHQTINNPNSPPAESIMLS